MKDKWVGNIYNNKVKLTLPPLVAWIKDNLDNSDNFFSPCGTWGRDYYYDKQKCCPLLS